jgi:hypothetical protein
MRNMRTLASFLALSLILVVLPAIAQPQDDEWKTISGSESIVFLYHPKRISRGATVKIWIKEMPSPDPTKVGEGRAHVIENRKASDLPIKGYERWSYTMLLMEYDCNGKYRLLSSADYNIEGEVLETINGEDSKWVYVTPETVSETIQKTACPPLFREQ